MYVFSRRFTGGNPNAKYARSSCHTRCSRHGMAAGFLASAPCAPAICPLSSVVGRTNDCAVVGWQWRRHEASLPLSQSRLLGCFPLGCSNHQIGSKMMQ